MATVLLVAGTAPAKAGGPPLARGLIVAVSEFADPKLAPFALAGATHDARRMAEAFRHFAGAQAPLAILEAGDATKARTEAELARLAQTARPKERIMLYFSAHGSRIPDIGEIDEADGLDEVLLLADAAEWDGEQVPGSLLDDDLARFVRAMRMRGADVFVVIDSCAAGGAARNAGAAAGGARARSLPPALLGVPQRPNRSARASGQGWIGDDMPVGSGRLVVFAAGPSDAVAWDTPDGGLFTTTLAPALMAGPDDFVALARDQQRRQAALPLPGPTAEMIGALASGFFFAGNPPDPLQRATGLPRPDWQVALFATAQQSCFEPLASSAPARALDPAAVLQLAHCDAVMLELAGAEPGRLDAWYLDSTGARTLLSPLAGLYLDGRAPARLSFTFVTHDPATGIAYPAGTDHLVLLRQSAAGGHDAAVVIALAVGNPDNDQTQPETGP